MAMTLQYDYAIVNKTMGYLCLEVRSTNINHDDYENDTELYIRIDDYNEEYLMKYYNVADGKWYHDAEFQNEATELN